MDVSHSHAQIKSIGNQPNREQLFVPRVFADTSGNEELIEIGAWIRPDYRGAT
jgi:hypothetical protein